MSLLIAAVVVYGFSGTIGNDANQSCAEELTRELTSLRQLLRDFSAVCKTAKAPLSIWCPREKLSTELKIRRTSCLASMFGPHLCVGSVG